MATISSALLRKSSINPPPLEGVPGTFVMPTKDLKSEEDITIAALTDLVILHKQAIAESAEGSYVRQTGQLLLSVLENTSPVVQALFSPVVEDYQITIPSIDYSDITPLAQAFANFSPQQLRQAQSGFQAYLQLQQDTAEQQLAANQTLGTTLLRGYERILQRLQTVSTEIATGAPSQWQEISKDIAKGGMSGAADALSIVSHLSFDSYRSFAAQAISAQAHMRLIDAHAVQIQAGVADATLWVTLCGSILRDNSDPELAAQMLKNKFLQPAKVKATAYVKSLIAKLAKKKKRKLLPGTAATTPSAYASQTSPLQAIVGPK